MGTNWIIAALALWLIMRQVVPITGLRKHTPKTVQALLEHGNVTVVDVRRQAEYVAGHFPQSQSIPLAEIRQKIPKIDRSTPMIFVCRSGYRARRAFHILKRRSFRGHGVLQGGIVAWEPLRTQPSRTGEI
jgi:rhodanese-related sulfurtransferase